MPFPPLMFPVDDYAVFPLSTLGLVLEAEAEGVDRPFATDFLINEGIGFADAQ